MVAEQIQIREGIIGILLNICNTIPQAQIALDAHTRETGNVAAPMSLLLEGFPYGNWVTANSEDYSGIDVDGKFAAKDEPIVATRHGGKEGKWGLLTPETIQKALDMHGKNQGGLNQVYAAVLKDLYQTNVLRQMLNGGMPDGRAVQVFSYNQLMAGECPRDGSEYIVVRPLSLARKTVSGYSSIARLTDLEGKVTDSQVVVYAGGVDPAQKVIDTAKWKFISGNLGVWHPFNAKEFNPNEAQGHVLFVGYTDYDGLGGNNNLLSSNGRFAVVAPEALDARVDAKKLEDMVMVRLPRNIVNAMESGTDFTYKGRTYSLKKPQQ